MGVSMAATDIIFSEEQGLNGFLGLISLNRIEAYNALSHEMILALHQQLQVWSQNPRLLAVMIRSVSTKVFCAGGDIRALYALAQKADRGAISRFFADEYQLIQTIHHFPRPFISDLSGIVMGGGVGISTHATHRMANESLRWAMPECAIGFFPDVGSSYFLPRCPGELGVYLGLSGASLSLADAQYCGLIDHAIAVEDHERVLQDIFATDLSGDKQQAIQSLSMLFNRYEKNPQRSLLAEHRQDIDEIFAGNDLEWIMKRAQDSPNVLIQKEYENLKLKSPLSLKVTLEQLRRGRDMDFETCMRMEYRLAQHFALSSNFIEGVRAQVIDKDKNPQWQPNSLDKIKDSEVKAYFSPVLNLE